METAIIDVRSDDELHEEYRRSIALGLSPELIPEIEDPELQHFLRSWDDPRWGVVQALLEGLIRIDPFPGLDELDGWLRREGLMTVGSPPANQFLGFLVTCVNRRICPEERLLEARRTMKRLNPQFHGAYMRRLERS